MHSDLQDPLVSIVVTTHNGEKYLAEQLDSIINQTYKNLEVIICDDASTDQTPQIIREYAARDARIVILQHTKNIRLHANLESGLKIAKGEYIAISDQDDIWLHEKIELLLKNIGEGLAIFSDSALIDENGISLNKTIMGVLKIKNKKTCLSLSNLLAQNVVSGHALLFRKDLISTALPFKNNLIFDHHLALTASMFNSLLFYPSPLVLHRLHSTNSTNSGLINKTSQTRKMGGSKLEGRQIRATRMLEKFLLLSTLMLTQQPLPQNDSMDLRHVFLKEVEPIIFGLSNFDTTFFNFSLFMRLLQFRRHCSAYEHFTLRHCLSLAKGAKWYRFFDRFNKT